MRQLGQVLILVGIWIGLFCAKYVTLSLASQLYWETVTTYWIIDLLVALLAAFVWSLVFSGLANGFGISLYHGMTADLSREKYTVTSYEGEIERGFLFDSVKLRARHKTTSEYDEMNKVFGFLMFADAGLFFFGMIETWLPWLQVF